MNIKEAQTKREIVESEILSLIQQFEKDVGLEVLDIWLEKIDIIGKPPGTVYVDLQVKL